MAHERRGNGYDTGGSELSDTAVEANVKRLRAASQAIRECAARQEGSVSQSSKARCVKNKSRAGYNRMHRPQRDTK